LGLPNALFSQTGSITNIQVSQRTDGSGNVDIYYNLVGPGSSYFISMEVSFYNGSTFAAVSPAFLTGNSGITPGINRHLIWDGKGSNNNTYSAQSKIKLIANTNGPCGQPFTVSHVVGLVAPVDKTVTYSTVTNIPGEPSKCWITSNLGSDHQATTVDDATEASAGWYWQFNRKQGYKYDGSMRTPNTIWITSISENLEWQTDNDPCSIELGSSWRIPTETEWENTVPIGFTNWDVPWNSGLYLHAAGNFYFTSGSLVSRGSYGFYWSNTQFNLNTLDGWNLFMCSSCNGMGLEQKAFGFTIRCLRD